MHMFQDHPIIANLKLQRALPRPRYIIPYSHVETDLKAVLGEGNFAKVVKGRYKKTEEVLLVAVKVGSDGCV